MVGAPDAACGGMASQTIDAEVLRTLGLGRHARRKRWIKRGIYLGLALVVAAGAVMLWRRAHQIAPVRYQTAVVERADLSVSVTATGTLEPATSVDVGPEISGRVLRVLADYNDHVEAGQILVVLDTELLSAQAAQADAQVALAQANQRQAAEALAEARRVVARDQPLGERGVIAAAQLDAERSAMVKAAAAEAAAAAQVRASRAAAAVVHTSLGKATIRAPIAGVVLARSVEEGQAVVAALQAPVFFELARDLDRMQLVVDIDEADIGAVRAGQRASFTVAAYAERSFPATVTSVRNSARIRDSVVTYQAVLEVDNRDGALRPGMTATAQLITESHPGAVTVPEAALRYRPAGEADTATTATSTSTSAATAHVYLLEAEQPRAVTVRAGASDGTRTVITGPVPVGARVIIDSKGGD